MQGTAGVSVFIGVDVSKAELVAAIAGQPGICRVANDAASIAAWLQGLPRDARVAMESTGRYHALLAQMAQQAGLTVYVLNARDVFFYARGLGMRAKTDRVDAHVIARYLAEHHHRLYPWRPGSALHQRVQQLLARRAMLAVQRQALRQALSQLPPGEVDTAPLQQAFDTLLRAIDARVQALIATDAQLDQGCQRLRTITGIGPQISALLGCLFSRLEFTNADAVVAYSGLDPRPDDSGTKRGRRRLSKKGPALLRRQMYLAAFAASHSKALQPLYERLRAQGFATTQALVILGRKLLRVAFAVWKHQQLFDLQRLMPQPPA